MSDLIRRQDAIDAISECTAWKMSKDDKLISKVAVVNELLLVPSAQPEYTEQDVRDSFNSGYACGMEAAQPEIIRCKDCIHNNDCDIQYSAQAGESFFCGFGETEKDVREDVYE